MAKNMGLYGERTGAIHVVTADKETAQKVLSQVKILVRTNYSSPPKHGARIAALLMNDPELRAEWYRDIRTVKDRLTAMRHLLLAEMNKLHPKADWSHLTKHMGMLQYTGLSKPQVAAVVEKHGIMMNQLGRISLCGVSTRNAHLVARAFKDVSENY